MLKVLQTFFDDSTHTLFVEGLEIADDPRLAFAEKRGLVKKIEEEKPKTEEVKEEKPKPVTKKKTTAKTKK